VENSLANTVIGSFSSVDQDASETFTYQLVSGPGSVDNNLFGITGTRLVALQPLNYEQNATPSIRVRSTDSGGNSLEKIMVITVIDANDLPTPPGVSNLTIAENRPVGTLVGTLSSIDEDSNDPTQFRLTGSGNDNAQFTINGNQLLSSAAFDFEQKSSYNIEIQAFDKSGNGPIRSFVVRVIDVNEAPSAIRLSDTKVSENNRAPTLIGQFSEEDPDLDDSAQFSFITGSGSEDNSRFLILGKSLFLSEVADFESKSSYSIRVKATDASGLSVESSFVVFVDNVEESPFDLSISNNVLSESPATNRLLGTLSAIEPDGQSLVYSLVSGAGDNAQFALRGNSVYLLPATDFETKDQYDLVARVMDPVGNFFEQRFVIAITDEEEAPVDVLISANLIVENQAVGVIVGQLNSIDSDRNETFSYSLVDGDGSSDNASFVIVSDQLRTNRTFDFESNHVHHVRIRTTDSFGLLFEKAISLRIVDENESPTLIQLSFREVPENSPAPIAVGTFSHNDPDAADSVLFTLVPGIGGTDNAKFEIVGNSLRLLEIANFEETKSYSINVRAQDLYGLFVDRSFTIEISDVNEAPFGLALSNLSLDESSSTNRFVGTISASDPDGNPLVYSLAPGVAENVNFTISGNRLFLSPATDHETITGYLPVLRATDPLGLFVDKTFSIQINDMPEAPTGVLLSNSQIAENQPFGTVVGLFSTIDQDAGETFSYALVPGAGGQNNSLFAISGNQLRTNGRFNFEIENAYSVRVRTIDSDGLSFESTFNINVLDLPEQYIQAKADFANTPKDIAVVISVLNNDADPDGFVDATTVSIVSPPTRGKISVRADGTIEYMPEARRIYSESFSYRVKDNDGEWSNTAAVAVHVESAFHNRVRPMDVNADGRIDSLDVLSLVNDINRDGQRDLPSELPYTAPYLDPNNDGTVSSLDVLMVVNFLNSLSSRPASEGESDNEATAVEPTVIEPIASLTASAVDLFAIDDYFRDLASDQTQRRVRRAR
jgi:hypothetical protein